MAWRILETQRENLPDKLKFERFYEEWRTIMKYSSETFLEMPKQIKKKTFINRLIYYTA